jgi:7,8-dihydropterin-6-yl-methyl-4-(beta-D-ribofuranosyl)aminobenzene 5'-phosphate synthase
MLERSTMLRMTQLLTIAALAVLLSACSSGASSLPSVQPKAAPPAAAASKQQPPEGLTNVQVDAAAAARLPADNFILNLYDAFGEHRPAVTQDFGFSALIRFRGTTILFDGGTNADILKRNAEALGVDLRTVDFAVASHSHFDHISGFDYLLEVNPKVKIYFPNDPFWGAPLPFDATGQQADQVTDLPPEQRYFGGRKTKFTFKQSGRFWKANVEFVEASRKVAPGIHLVTTRSPFMGYFSRYPNVGVKGDAVKDDSAIKTLGLPEISLSLETPDGEVLIVGCSHSLVVRIVEETRRVVSPDIAMVMGGFHLLPYGSADIRTMAARMKDEFGVKRVAPAHCTGHLGFKIFREVFGDGYHLAGLGSVVPFGG